MESHSTPRPRDVSDNEPPPSKRRRKGQSMEALLAREVGLMRGGYGDTSASFVGSASGIHFIRSVYDAVGTPIALSKTSPETNLVPGEDDRLDHPAPIGAQKRIWHDQEIGNDNEVVDEGAPSFDDLLDWSESFFDNWHPAFPFLHAPSVLGNLEKLSQNGLSNLPAWDTVTLKAIISISLADRRQSGRVLSRSLPGDLVFKTFEDAHEAILPALTRPATIKGLQAVLCVQLFFVSMLRLNTASRLGGLVVQMAFQLGMHRCPMRFQTFSHNERQLRKRIFWSMYCIERYVCQAMGLPLTIRDEDADVCHLNEEIHHPNPQLHGPSSQSDHSSIEEPSSSHDGRLQLLVLLSRHAQLRGSIIELRNKRVEERDRSPDAAVFIGAKLTQWWNEVKDFFDENEATNFRVSHLHKTILETSKHESVIMLHRPMLALQKSTASYSSAIHACIGAAKSLLSILNSLLESNSADADGSSQVPMIWPSFTWAAWMSAFILLYGTTESVVNGQVAARNVDKSLRILDKLASRGSIWPNASAVAIQDLRSILTQRRDLPMTPTSAIANSDLDPQLTSQQNSSARDRIEPSLQRHQSERTSSPAINSQSATLRNSSRLQTHDATGAQNRLPSEPSYTGYSQAWPTSLTVGTTQGQAATNSRTSGHNLPEPRDTFPETFGSNSMWTDPSFLPKDVPPEAFGGVDPFQGFDIPFWFGQDNYTEWMGNDA